ncbi:MAG: hypothetical protein AAB492_04665 [Patescibacteria group bacterium]
MKIGKVVLYIAIVLVALFGWRFISILQVPDKTLSELNSSQPCSASVECGRGGCNGEICGRGGDATICYPDPKLADKLRGKQCSCMQEKCQWSKPLIGGL